VGKRVQVASRCPLVLSACPTGCVHRKLLPKSQNSAGPRSLPSCSHSPFSISHLLPVIRNHLSDSMAPSTENASDQAATPAAKRRRIALACTACRLRKSRYAAALIGQSPPFRVFCSWRADSGHWAMTTIDAMADAHRVHHVLLLGLSASTSLEILLPMSLFAKST
jgi:hypothetical protein